MDTLAHIGAQYLWILSPLAVLGYFLKLPREKRKELLVYAAIILPLAFLLGLLAKWLWVNPTPLHPEENGFPSDHTLLVASLATLLFFFNKKLSVWLWAIAGIVAASRVYVGEHHIIDVIGSIGIALLSGTVAYAIISALWNHKHNKTIS